MTVTVSKRKRHPTATFSTTTTEAPRVSSEVAAVLTGLPGGVIDGGEIVLLALKPSMWRPFFDSVAWIVAACLLAAISNTIGQPIPGLSLSVTAQVILLAGFARLGVATAQWAPQWYVLTNRRIINIQGIWVPSITSWPLVEIRNTYVRRSAAETVTGLGSILFATNASSGGPHLWRSIREPNVVHARIRRAIEHAIDLHAM